jgi:hypothetical protein
MRNRTIGLLSAWTLSACEPAPDRPSDLDRSTLQRTGEADDEAPSVGREVAADALDCGIAVSTTRELMITDLAVVEDPVRTSWNGDPTDPVSGAWHFGKLMTHMAGADDPSAFVLEWLQIWTSDVVANGQTVPARPAMGDIIDAWPRLGDGRLDLTQSPMRLLAIVNRIDLRDADDAGEGRFVFGVLDGGSPLQFTVILEYDLPLDVQTVDAWAAEWHALGTLAPGSTAYNEALQEITDAFSGPGVLPARPNGSAISQVRTNEIALDFPWELRELRISTAGDLQQRGVALTPIRTVDGTNRLGRFINRREDTILAGTHNVPRTFEGTPFRAMAITNNIDTWSTNLAVNPEARHLFSLNTCNGCHGAETDTTFLHVNPRSAGAVASLSAFMTGIDVIDPVDGVTVRRFDDLGRRAADLESLLCEAQGAAIE